MRPLELPLHPKFEAILGYGGNADKVVFYLEPEADKLCYADGFGLGSANTWAYLLWAAHPSVKPHYRSGMLLLDRLERKLYVVNREEAIEALSEPREAPSESNTFGLQLHGHHPQDSASAFTEAQQLMADFVIWLGSQGQRRAA